MSIHKIQKIFNRTSLCACQQSQLKKGLAQKQVAFELKPHFFILQIVLHLTHALQTEPKPNSILFLAY